VFLWNMDPGKIEEDVRKEWERVILRITQEEYDGLIQEQDESIIHVKPLKSSKRKIETPQGMYHPILCFWWNDRFIADLYKAN